MTTPGQTDQIEVAIVRTGVANMASVVAAFERLGARTVVTTDPELVAGASHVMLPGVGAFGAGMGALNAAGLSDALIERIRADRPTIAICLGLQLLCESSEETPGVLGLGVLPVQVTRFAGPGKAAKGATAGPGKAAKGATAGPGKAAKGATAGDTLKVPQLGWNRVEAPPAARFLKSGHAYFANSFRIAGLSAAARPLQRDVTPHWLAAYSEYGGTFVAALERGNILACQFHPELSGPWGQDLLKRWLATEVR